MDTLNTHLLVQVLDKPSPDYGGAGALAGPHECIYILSSAPPETALPTLVQVASIRFTSEQCLEEANGETDLNPCPPSRPNLK